MCRFENGTDEKHQACSGCGLYASDRHEDGWAVRPARSPTRFSDGSTGEWTCTRCASSPHVPDAPSSRRSPSGTPPSEKRAGDQTLFE